MSHVIASFEMQDTMGDQMIAHKRKSFGMEAG